MRLLLDWHRRGLGLILQLNLGVGGYDVGYLKDTGCDSGVVVSLAQKRHHESADIAYLGVGQNAFEAIADFDPVVMIFGRKQHKRGAIGALFADLPLFFQPIGKIRLVVSVEIVEDDDLDLCVGLGVAELAAKAVELLSDLG